MKIGKKTVALSGTKGYVRIKRMEGGFPRIEADHEIDLYYGLGYMHGIDRRLYIWLLKLIGRGVASEHIRGDDDLIEIDKYMRWIDLGADASDEYQKMPPDSRQIIDTYCKGVNDAVGDTGIPFEFRMVGYKPDRWMPEDVILLGMMMGFVGLSQSQGDFEKFIIQMIRNGVTPAQVKELFPSIEEEITDELVGIIKKLELAHPIIPASVKWSSGLPGLSASNNWAVGPEKTASGKAMLCGDPHLEMRLPSIWYNTLMVSGDYYVMGATVPGLPVVAAGRSPALAWSPTYGVMDASDYFIEEVRGKRYRRGATWVPFTVREEVIRPKKRDPVTVRYYENEHGVLEGKPDKDGYYLCFAWSARRGTVGESISSLLKVPKAKNVEEGMEYFSRLTFAAFTWVLADSDGNIGLQMSGSFPKKAEGTSGLVPYLGWDESQDWQGVISPEKHPRAYNPEEGYVVSANDDLNRLGEVSPVKLPMSSYRADRIRQFLEKKNNHTVDDMKQMHYDVYSLQAERFMEIIRPLLPATRNGELLKNWDLQYGADSMGAVLFERVYNELITLVFGEGVMGVDVLEHVIHETPLFAFLHGNFDRILLQEESNWFGGASRKQIFTKAIERGLKEEVVEYGTTREVYMTNIFFGGKLPKFLGFDYGPVELIGSRAAVHQGQIFRAAGRPTTFCPTLRIITDFETDILHINIAGGPSDRRFSGYYTTGIKEWLSGVYSLFKP
jgi:penicillin amidase